MSKDTICPNCSAPTGGEAICPSCFFSQPQTGHLYTVDALSRPTLAPTTSPAKMATFQALKFLPSSPFKRAWLKIRGPVSTLLCGLIFIAGSFYFWVGYQMELAQAQEREALQAQQSKQSTLVLKHWNKAHEHYRSAFSTEGRLRALLAIADCHIASGEHEMAISTLSRAEDLGDPEAVAKTLAKCHAHWGAVSLQNAIESLQSGSYGNAVLEAEKALDSLEKSDDETAQLAKVHRILALGLAKAKQFESAELHLQEALKLEGPTVNNKSTEKRVKKLARAQQKKPLAHSKDHRYISNKKLDLSKTKQMKRRRRRHTSGYSRPQARTSVSSPSGYPKYRPPQPSYNPAAYSSQNHQRPYAAPPSRPSYPKPNYPRVQHSRPQVNRPQVKAPSVYKPPSYSPPSYSPPNRRY